MNPETYQRALHKITRRHFFQKCGVGLGSIALGEMLGGRTQQAFAGTDFINPIAPKAGHFPAKAKNVIYLFMAGGPSQLELFDYKPKLQELNDQVIPDSYMEGKRFAFMGSSFKAKPKLLGTRREFNQYGECGAWVSECFPHMSTIVDDISFIKTVQSAQPNHAPAKIYMNTGSFRFGRPSMGSWVTYGIGSENENLPGFVVMLSGPRGPRGGTLLWGNGFLPSAHQGVSFRSGGDPILNLSNPEGVDSAEQRDVIDTINTLNRQHLNVTGDDEISARISSYEMAYRMQTSAPELMDFSGESPETMKLYGIDDAGAPSFAKNCLLARRLVERGVRFVQLYHTSWDHHGGSSENLDGSLDEVTHDVDQACAALVKDLKGRGMLEDTLVIWGGEFGRTPMGEVRDTIGRNHHIDSATVWMAGGGVKAGYTLGETDELGFNPISDPVPVHDLHATILHLLGLDHERLTYRFKGRDFRLTDVSGEVLEKLLV
ncbi:MAG: DUF1501 domain-containing protein [Candidatus Omnitrophica bacterium]|nr:DUF1501 domain-containing protein [Candidatus Omnitrophota bacterium]